MYKSNPLGRQVLKWSFQTACTSNECIIWDTSNMVNKVMFIKEMNGYFWSTLYARTNCDEYCAYKWQRINHTKKNEIPCLFQRQIEYINKMKNRHFAWLCIGSELQNWPPVRWQRSDFSVFTSLFKTSAGF